MTHSLCLPRLQWVFTFCMLLSSWNTSAHGEDIQLLFLGDNGPHRPVDRFAELEPVLRQRGIVLKYTDTLAHLHLDTLNQFDGLILYANIDSISSDQADALLDYVNGGKAFIPLHCATYCFRNDPRMIALMGAQFLKHGGEIFSTEVVAPDHSIMKGYGSFRSWDETYVHHLHNPRNRTVLEVRKQGVQAEGNNVEPWTWIRTQGKGRVFYTAWGHDHRTWQSPGFHNLIERGIRWATGGDPSLAGPYQERDPFIPPAMTQLPQSVKPFQYLDVGAKIPNYVPSTKWGVQADPLTTMQLPLPAEESVKHFVTPEDFELQIYATENFSGNEESKPAYAGFIGKPIAMNWDERGRLWVCETVDYPNELMPHNRGRDRIRICEDTDQDGKADKFTTFAEHLSIPTAITFHRGGVIVQNGTETLWLKDDDGDDVADRREVIISNWKLGDTHGGVSNIRYGLDNWFWAMQGYNASEPIIAATGEKQPGFRMGFWRFQLDDSEPPRVTSLEFIRSTDNNTWGLGISEEGLIFGSTANRNPSTYMPIPNRYYEKVRGWGPQQLKTIADTYLFEPITDRIRQVDQHGGYTAAAGHALYTGRNYPQQWWNRTAFVCGPTGKLVGTFVLDEQGAGYTSSSPMNLIASNDEWTAPIAAEVGPDGNVWILDWYNYIVQHNPTPQGFQTGKGQAYESDLRDKKHGRVYRLVYAPNNNSAYPILIRDDSELLLKGLQSTSMLVRLHAQRLLIERGNLDIAPQLSDLARAQELDEIGLAPAAIHALKTLDGLGYFRDPSPPAVSLLKSCLQHPSAGVRRAALQSLTNLRDAAATIAEFNLLDDQNPQVRLAAFLALADLKEEEALAGKFIADQFWAGTTLNDRWLADGLTSAAANHAKSFLAEVAISSTTHQQQLSPQQINVLSIVSEHLSRLKPERNTIESLVDRLNSATASVSVPILQGLIRGWPKDYQLKSSPELEKSLAKLLTVVPPKSKADVIQLASRCGSQSMDKQIAEIVETLLTIAEDLSKPTEERVTSVEQLVQFRGNDNKIIERVIEIIGAQASPELTQGVLEALKSSNANNLATALIERTRAMTPSAKSLAMDVLLARPQITLAFLKHIEAGEISVQDLSLEQQRTLSDHPDQSIRERARKIMLAGGGLPNPDRQKVVDQLLPLTHQKGDVELGKAVYVKHCSKCHQHGDLGENIGPNLTGMAVHPKEELLIHIMDPSRSVEGNFRLYTVVTTAGRIQSGMMAAESRTSIELVDTEAKRTTIAREDIEELLASPKSLMPEGFEKQLTNDDLRHLLEFLTNKGKFVPIDFRKLATVVSTSPMFYGSQPVERLVFPDWKPKVFEGIPFILVDPKGTQIPNVIMLNGPNGKFPPQMPREVEFPVNTPASKIHILGGIGGWSFPAEKEPSTSVILKVNYEDGQTETIELKNGIHFADYIRRVDVPGSRFAYNLNGQQVRYIGVPTARQNVLVKSLTLSKGNDRTAPIFVAITIETP